MYKHLKKHVHTRVLVQLVIFSLVSVALFIAVGFAAVAGQIGPGLVALALAAGGVVGYFVGKIFKLSWHDDTRKVIMQLDRTGFLLIGLYIAFRIVIEQMLGSYVHGAALNALTFAFLSGLLLGRFVSVWYGVKRILHTQGIL